MYKICPCSNAIEAESFIFFIIIIDIIMGIGTIFGMILPLVGLIIYFSQGSFESGYFRCYAITRFIFGIIGLFALIGFSIYLMIVGIDKNPFFKGDLNPYVVVSIFYTLYIPFLIWHLYLSWNFMSATKKESQIAEPLTDIEKNDQAISEQSKKKLNEEKSVDHSLENKKEQEEKI